MSLIDLNNLEEPSKTPGHPLDVISKQSFSCHTEVYSLNYYGQGELLTVCKRLMGASYITIVLGEGP